MSSKPLILLENGFNHLHRGWFWGTIVPESVGGSLKTKLRYLFYILIVPGIIVAIDQFTKGLVRQNLALGESWMPLDWLAPYARVLHWYNTGVAFGLFQGGGIIFILLPIVIVVGILVYFPRIPDGDWTLRLALSLQLGGALGNLVDRITIGHVTDFISVGQFPVFNIADSAITIGVIVLILGVWIQEKREKAARENRPPVDVDSNESRTEFQEIS